MKEYKLLAVPTAKIEETIAKTTPEMYNNYYTNIKSSEPYENIVRNVNAQLLSLIKHAQADVKTGGLSEQDREFLLYDSIPRCMDAVKYALSAIEAHEARTR